MKSLWLREIYRFSQVRYREATYSAQIISLYSAHRTRAVERRNAKSTSESLMMRGSSHSPVSSYRATHGGTSGQCRETGRDDRETLVLIWDIMPTLYRKEDFQQFILENITKGVSVNGRPASSVRDMLSFCLAFIWVGAGFFIIGLIILSSEFSGGAIIFTLFPLLFIGIGIWKALQLRVYRNLEKYFEVKELLLEKSLLLEKLKKDDEEKKGVDPLLVEEFAVTLRTLGEAYAHLEKPVKVISRGWWHFSKDTRAKLEDFISTEQIWIVAYMRDCQSILWNWMSHHESELREIIEQNTEIQTTMPGWADAITLANTRLDTHIESLEKVRIRL